MVTCLTKAQSFDYSPCTYGPEYDFYHAADCMEGNASEVLDAFRRNGNNSDIDSLNLQNMTDMTDGMLAEIMGVVAASASQNVRQIILGDLKIMEMLPEALMEFTNLQHLFLFRNDALKILPYGSLTLPSRSLTQLYCYYHPNLQVIEGGAFQGMAYNRIDNESSR